MSDDCRSSVCCPPNDFEYSAQEVCPTGYTWDGLQCVPPEIALPPCTVVTITTSEALPDGAVDTPYSQTLNAAGSTAPYTWFLYSGSLPDGLALDTATGEISGTPTTPGDYEFTIQASDEGGHLCNKTFTLSVPIP